MESQEINHQFLDSWTDNYESPLLPPGTMKILGSISPVLLPVSPVLSPDTIEERQKYISNSADFQNYISTFENESPPITDDSASEFILSSAGYYLPNDLTVSHLNYSSSFLPTFTSDLISTEVVKPLKSKSKKPSKFRSRNGKFECEMDSCGKIFKRMEHLKRHQRMHTGEKPFVCDLTDCGRKFSRADNLSAHRRTHAKNGYKLLTSVGRNGDDDGYY